MSRSAKQILLEARLPGFTGRGDKYLGDLAVELRRRLWKTQNEFTKPAFRLPDGAWADIAVLLVEMGEDIHNDLGLWRALEQEQGRIFGVPLPLVGVAPGAELRGMEPLRFQYFLWILWPLFGPDRVVSPTHPDMRRLAEVAGRFLAEQFARIPRDSGLKHFLATPNTFGWDIKRKLLWVGLSSYLFRFLWFESLDESKGEPDIATKDSWVCARATAWAGLGVSDILAGALDLPEADRATLRTWYERHRSYYRITARQERGGAVECVVARNVVNGQSYTIRMNQPNDTFQLGVVIAGAVTPWRGEWYWSGQASILVHVPESEEPAIRKEVLQKSSALAYVFCLEEAEKAREFCRNFHAAFVVFYGGDLVAFPDGLTLAAAEQRRMTAHWAAAAPETVAEVMARRGLKHPRPAMNFPPEFLRHEQGIGMFSNPEEGVEMSLNFNVILSGLRKRGRGLTADEMQALHAFITSTVISPLFVRRLVAEHGAESIAETFFLRDCAPEAALEFLLRRSKGAFFRKRYPTLALL